MSAKIPLSGHFFLLHLVIYDVPARELCAHLVRSNPQLGHEDERVVGQIGELVDRLAPVARVGRDNDLGALLPDLLEYLVEALFEEIARVAALRLRGPAVEKELIEPVY